MLPASPHTIYFSHYHSKRTLKTPSFCQVLSLLNTTGQGETISLYFESNKLRGRDKNICLIDYMVWVLSKDFPGFWEKKNYKYIWMSCSFNPEDLQKVKLLNTEFFLNTHFFFFSVKGKRTHVYGASILQEPFHTLYLSISQQSQDRRGVSSILQISTLSFRQIMCSRPHGYLKLPPLIT